MNQNPASGDSRATPIRRRGGLQALAASGLFTCASFFASFFTIVLVVRDVSVAERAGFFLFLAMYGPITTVLSQRFLLSIYQSREIQGLAKSAELAVIALMTIAAVGFVIVEYFNWIEALALVCVIFSQTFAATASGSIQHRSKSSPRWAILVFLIATGRIAFTWLMLPFGPVIAFAAGAYSYLAGMLVLKAIFTRRLEEQEQGGLTATLPQEGWRERIAEFAFFVSGALLFQADKYALSTAGRLEDLSQSGALTTLLLSPLSILFATLYRTRSNMLFDAHRTWRERLAQTPQIALLFLGGALAFLVTLLLILPGITQLVFPFLSLSASLYLMLAFAIIADRMISLLTFTGMDWRIYLTSAGVRLAIFATVMLGAQGWIGGTSLSDLYIIYLVGAVIALVLVGSTLVWIQNSHVRR